MNFKHVLKKSLFLGLVGIINSNGYTQDNNDPNLDFLRAWNNWEDAVRCEVYSEHNCRPRGRINANYPCSNGGNVNWTVIVHPLPADSTFTYDNCLYDGMTVTGSITGSFRINGNSTGEGTSGTINISGNYNGVIEDHVVIINSERAGGYYLVTCTDPGCALGAVRINLPYD
tara:strand:+ start:877 stop:1392 length:516 start_codon:yes stop_codon:yes gene_type:complete